MAAIKAVGKSGAEDIEREDGGDCSDEPIA